jgi:hypothetical protein
MSRFGQNTKGKIWLGHNIALLQQIFSTLHSSAMGGLFLGFPVTYSKFKQLFHWYVMKSMIKQWVQCCQICNQAKPNRAK